MQPPEDLTALRALQHGGNATGIAADLRDLSAEDLTHLEMHLALIIHQLSQRFAADQAIPDQGEE